MKKLLYTLAALFVSNLVLAQTPTENYVSSTSPQVPVQTESAINALPADNKTETITYYDGLGRPKQSIAKQAGGDRQDIITPVVYDDFGRQVINYLPATRNGSSLDYDQQDNTFFASLENSYIAKFPDDLNVSTPNPYSEKHLESSPLNRVLEQGAPGLDWLVDKDSSADHTIKFEYQINSFDLNDVTADNVAFYDVIFPTGKTEEPQLYFNDYYEENQLYKTITKDENWTSTSGNNHTTEEFKNKQGQVLLKRTYNQDIKHDTYYIYDDYGNLSYVISPKGSNEILSTNTYKKINQSINHKEFVPSDIKGLPITTGSGNVNIILDDINNTLQVNIDMSFNASIELEQGQIALLEQYVPDMIVGTTANNYLISIQGGFLHISGSETVSNITDSFTVNLPAHSVNNTTIEDLCYQYHYDYRNRLVEKKIPGKDWEYIVYDKLDRPVLTQDALLRENNEWLFTKYDALGRVTYTGKHLFSPVGSLDNSGRLELQEDLNNSSSVYDEKTIATTINGTTIYYTNTSIPNSNLDIYTINYYDDYNNIGLGTDLNYQDSYGQIQSQNDKSLSTVSKVRVLGTNDWITTVSYYDEKARPIFSISRNDYLNTLDWNKTQLDFVGKVLETTTKHEKNGQSSITTIDTFTYDHTGRLITQKQQIGDDVPELIAKNYYDELGQLEKKDVGGETILDGYTDLVGVEVDVNTGNIIKIGSNNWDAGIATKGKFNNGGFVTCVAEQNNKSFMFGLSPTNHANPTFTNIHFAIYLAWNGVVKVYESGANIGSFGTYQAGDSFKVERVGNQILYSKNNTVFYTSMQNSSGSLLGDVSIKFNGCVISNLKTESTDLNSVLQTVDYKYNIRGWLKEINDVEDLATDEDLFGFKLNYNTQEYNLENDRKLYNGNISETIWNSTTEWTPSGITNPESQIKRAYTYTYDDLNRITQGIFTKTSGANQDVVYNLKHVDYDRNGNIAVLRRSGANNSGASINFMDHLTYTYHGNQLTDVLDLGHNYFGFAQKTNNQTGDYIYDANGNMVRDYNKNIGDNTANADGITYNHLNLPTQVVFNNNNTNNKIDYIYDATGIKLEKRVTEAGVLTNTKYAGNFIYEETLANGEELKFFNHPEGYVEKQGLGLSGSQGAYKYIYQYKDHIGNIRLSYSDSNNDGAVNASEIIEENNYYPFGLKHKGYNNVVSANANSVAKKFGYNGKELQDELGLNMYDYGARFYDPAVGRWFTPDALAEKYFSDTTYGYALENPILFIDPDGNMVEMCCQGLKDFLFNDTGKGKPVLTLGLHHIKLPIAERTEGDFGGNVVKSMYNGIASTWNAGMEGENMGDMASEGLGELGDTTRRIENGGGTVEDLENLTAGGAMAVVRGKLGKGKTPSVKEQAISVKNNLNGGKNRVTVGTVDGATHFDLDSKSGTGSHKGVGTPHVQKSEFNTNPATGTTHLNKNNSFVRPMTQQDIRTVKKVLNNRKKNENQY